MLFTGNGTGGMGREREERQQRVDRQAGGELEQVQDSSGGTRQEP